MKSNKVAPLSCYCKLSVLMLHLKNLSGRPASEMPKGAALAARPSAEALMKTLP
jgi:hypothetical protein